MGWFYVSGENGTGRRTVVRVQADNTNDAKAIAAERGLVDIIVETDEVSAVILRPERYGNLSDDEVVRIRRMGRWQNHYFVLKKLLLQQIPLIAIATGYLCYARLMRWPWKKFDNYAVMAIVAALLVPFIIRFWPTKLKQLISQNDSMIKAFVFGEWQEVIVRCDRLLGMEIEGRIPESEIAFRRAEAMCHLGQTADAFELVSDYVLGHKVDPICPTNTLRARLADLHDTCGEPKKAMQCIQEAAEHDSTSPVLWLDLATKRILAGDVTGTSEALAKARSLAMSREVLLFEQLTTARIDNHTGKFSEAIEKLLLVRREFVAMAAACELWQLMIADTDLELSISYANTADYANARKRFHDAAPLILKHARQSRIRRFMDLTRSTSIDIEKLVADEANPYRFLFHN